MIRRAAQPYWVVAVVLWLAMAGLGLAWLASYKSIPGRPGHPPASWPDHSRVLRDPARPNLVLLAHPHCPCTRASLEELSLIMTRCQGRVTAHVLLLRPKGFRPEWVQTDLWRSAAAIPGVRVLCDDEGVEANRFGAAISGSVVLYDRNGNLLFSGGITGARGHIGENAGYRSVISWLCETGAAPARTDVFGCPLFDQAAEGENHVCKP